MKKTILFDLDGTLLQMEQKQFESEYFKKLSNVAVKNNYDVTKFQSVLWKAVKAMYQNTGEQTNEQVFWNLFKQEFGEDILKLEPHFYNFYFNEYNEIKSIVKQNPYVKQIIEFAKQNFEYVILATNPFFPKFGIENRLNWVNLSISDFNYATSYENSHYSKPNPKYYKEILSKFNLQPSDCIMVGNNELEDYITATNLGIESYLVGDFVMPYSENNTHLQTQTIKLENLINVLKEAKNH